MQLDRRSLLRWCALFGVATAAGRWLPADTPPEGSAPDAGEWLTLGKFADLPENERVRITMAARVPSGKAVKKPKLLALKKGQSVFVMSSKCTHRGCEVDPQGDGTYLCPCHGSKYDKLGTVTEGPAKQPLSWFEVRITESGEVEVNIARPVGPPAEL